MTMKSLAEQAAELAARRHKVKRPLVVDSADAVHPTSNERIHRFQVVSAADANGPAVTLLLNENGEPVESTPELEALFDRTVLTTAGAGPGVAPITISPDTNVLTLNPGDTLDETITVTIPKSAGSAKADVYFLADTTSSMGGILNAVQVGANTVLSALAALPVDMVFGVGNYRDFASGDPYAFQHQVSPTNVTATVTAAINTWFPSGGGDRPEADLFALDSLAVPPGGGIGWRAGSKRIIVWFGDAPGHDPICTAVSTAPLVTEASATAKLVAEGITVLAISTANPGLDDDPKLNAGDYSACGAPGGTAGQATRITAATGGVLATGINSGNIVNTIINLVTGAVGGINNVKLVPSASIAGFVTSITPPGGYGPLPGDKENILTFDVKFTGTVPCKPEAQVFTGTLDVVADGKVVAQKRVQITVPACGFVYTVKFICGEQPDCGCQCAPVQPGRYATEINIHNFGLKEIAVQKRFIPLVLANAPLGREPRVSGVRAEDKIALPAQTATFDDCCRIAELLFGGPPPSPMPLTIGFLELTASGPLAVTAVYTTSGLNSSGVSIAVEQITARRA